MPAQTVKSILLNMLNELPTEGGIPAVNCRQIGELKKDQFDSRWLAAMRVPITRDSYHTVTLIAPSQSMLKELINVFMFKRFKGE